MLSLSCNLPTLQNALPGGLAALRAHLPFAYVDLVGGGGSDASVEVHEP